MTLAAEQVVVAGWAGQLEAVVEDTHALGDREALHYAVLCHPHPLFGGTLDNKVVTTLARALHDSGIPTVRFNFRGVGASEGVFDAGRGETDDARAVLDWGASRWPNCKPVIAGFSFGAYVALRLTQNVGVARLITVAPPVSSFDFSGLRAPSCPWMVVQGDADDVVDPQKVLDWAKALQPQPRLMVMRGAGHFFHGRLHELRKAVVDAIREG